MDNFRTYLEGARRLHTQIAVIYMFHKFNFRVSSIPTINLILKKNISNRRHTSQIPAALMRLPAGHVDPLKTGEES